MNFDELINTIEKSREFCPWTKKQTIDSYANELKEEVSEALKAIGNKDWNNLKEELGDILWDTLMLIHIAEDKGLLKKDDVVKGIIEKMKRRKPFIFENRHATIEEAWEAWNKAKKEENEEKNGK